MGHQSIHDCNFTSNSVHNIAAQALLDYWDPLGGSPRTYGTGGAMTLYISSSDLNKYADLTRVLCINNRVEALTGAGGAKSPCRPWRRWKDEFARLHDVIRAKLALQACM